MQQHGVALIVGGARAAAGGGEPRFILFIPDADREVRMCCSSLISLHILSSFISSLQPPAAAVHTVGDNHAPAH